MMASAANIASALTGPGFRPCVHLSRRGARAEMVKINEPFERLLHLLAARMILCRYSTAGS